MNEANTARIVAAAPRLFQRGFYFECMDGWADLLERLFARLDECAPDECVADQVKEKFGTLRCYLSIHGDACDAAIYAAEAESRVTCEACGKPGELRGGRWLKVRCLACLRAEEPREFKRDPF